MNIDRLNMHNAATGSQSYDTSSSFDFGNAFRVLKRKSRLIATFTLASLLLGLLSVLLSGENYEARTNVLLEAPSLAPFGRDQVYAGAKFDNVMIESQIQVIRSPMLLSQVVEILDLDSRQVFWEPPQSEFQRTISSFSGRISTLIGQSIVQLNEGNLDKTSGLSSLSAEAEEVSVRDFKTARAHVLSVLGSLFNSGDEEIEISEAERFRAAVEKLRDDTTVTRNGVTSVLSIKTTANTPELAAEITNAVAQAYVMQRYDMRRVSAETASGWFETRMQELSQQAALAEDELSAASGLSSRISPTPASSGTVQSADTVASLRASISTRITAQANFDQTMLASRSKNPLGILPPQAASSEFAMLSRAFSTAQGQTERDRLNKQAAKLLPELLESAQARLDNALSAEAAARAAIENTITTPATEQIDLGRLESEARVYREMYENYTSTYLRTKEQQTFPVVDATVLGVAQPPNSASGTSHSQILLIAGLLGLTIGSGLAFVKESCDPLLRTRTALAKAVGGPVIGILPPADVGRSAKRRLSVNPRLPAIGILKPRLERSQPSEGSETSNVVPLPKHRLALTKLPGQMSMTLTDPLSRYSDTVRRIRVAFDNYFAPHHDKRGSVIGFLSDQGAETRSTLAMNYAEMTAVGGQKTLLIDFDWLEAFLSRAITPTAGFGMTDLVYSMSPNFAPDDVYWVDERSGLFFLPNRAMGRNEPVDPATFDTALLTLLVASLSQKFEQIVIDFPSLGDSVDAAGLSSVVDGFVCTADWGGGKSQDSCTEHRNKRYPR